MYNQDDKVVELIIAKDFSKTPAGRSAAAHGKHSGETFREELLWPKLSEAITSSSVLVVVLDGTAGYPASFLDEAFGGLIRNRRCSKEDVKKHLIIKVNNPAYEAYKKLIDRYINEAIPQQNR